MTVYYILKDTVAYLKKHEEQTMDPTTLAAYNYYKNWFEMPEEQPERNRVSSMNDVSREMAKIACHALSDKKAEDVQVIDISEISVIADYFVIASAANTNQLQAMMDAAEEELYKAGYHCAQKEGNNNSSWILMDYKDIIIHLFSKEDRLFYDLERIWQDGKVISPEEL